MKWKMVDVDLMQESDWIEALQVYVVVGEVVETVEHQESGVPLPYFAGAFAMQCFLVQADPSHPIFPPQGPTVAPGQAPLVLD